MLKMDFADCLFSDGVVNEEQRNMLINQILYPSYQSRNKALLDMLIPNLNIESTCNSFMEALVETDQRHVYNFIYPSGGYLRSLLLNQSFNLRYQQTKQVKNTFAR